MRFLDSSNLGLFSKVFGYNIFKKTNHPKILPIFLTISVNDWCNSRCKTCNIWKNNPKTSKSKELKLEEYEKIFEEYGKTYWVTITGGEPFLRNDLLDIIKIVYDKTRPTWMTITTNGTAAVRTKRIIKEALEYCSDLRLIVNVSIDGIGKQHDNIRGFRGSFKLATNTFKKLKRIKNHRLTVGINTVISNYNIGSFEEIFSHINDNLDPDSYVVEVAENRSKLHNMDLKITPTKKKYSNALKFLIEKTENQNKTSESEIIKKIRINYYRSLISNEHQTNFEGIASAYIMSNGELWLSDSKKMVIGNLRNVGYDFKKLWFDDRAKSIRSEMSRNYSTILANAFYVNFVCNPKSFFRFLFPTF